MKWGPTWSNTLPLRIVYVTTPDGKARLLPHLQPGNVGKATQAPVNANLAVDSAFHHQSPWYERLPRLDYAEAVRHA